MGNRLTLNDNGTLKTYTYNSVNELTSSSEGSYTYDQNGNTLTDAQGRSYVWDQQNRVKEVTKAGTTVRFTYRADGLRARKEVVGELTTDYVYDGQTVVGEKRSDGKSVWYTPGAMGYISRMVVNDATGQVIDKEWFVYDGHSSTRAIVKPNATGDQAVVVARYDYDVYDAVRTQTGSSSNTFKYVASIGHSTDEETGLIYMRARYYAPSLGRFITEDAAQHRANWFTYASGNPTNRIDPDGATDYAELAISMSISALLNGLLNGVISFAQTGNFWSGFVGGAVGGALSVFGPLGSIGGAFASSFITNLMNGAGLYNSLKRALVSAGVAGAGTFLALNFGEIKNAQLTWALIAFDADVLVDAAVGFSLL